MKVTRGVRSAQVVEVCDRCKLHLATGILEISRLSLNSELSDEPWRGILCETCIALILSHRVRSVRRKRGQTDPSSA